MKTLSMSKREAMYARIKEHGENLNAIFNTGIEPITLCKKLHRLEVKAHRLATDYCNGENGVNSDNWEAKVYPILSQVNKILGVDGMNSFIIVNGDARGYALKISEAYCANLKIHKDWGGYGIIAPDFSI